MFNCPCPDDCLLNGGKTQPTHKMSLNLLVILFLVGKCNTKTKVCECNNGVYPDCEKIKCTPDKCRPNELCEEVGDKIICTCPNGENPKTKFCDPDCSPFSCGNNEICILTR